MMPSPTRRPLATAAALLLGAVCVAGSGLRHPLLVGDGPAQLATIGAEPLWHMIHLALIVGEVLLVAGVMGVALECSAAGRGGPGWAGAVVFALGVGLALTQIFFMGGAAMSLAAAYARGEPGLAATQAVFTYDMLHPSAQLAGRGGEFAMGLGLAVLGWGVAAVPSYRWLGIGGVGAGGACAAWALATPERAPMLMAGVGLVTIWAATCGAVLLARGSLGVRSGGGPRKENGPGAL